MEKRTAAPLIHQKGEGGEEGLPLIERSGKGHLSTGISISLVEKAVALLTYCCHLHFESTTIPFALSSPRVNLDEAPHPGWGVALWIDCDDVNELHAKLETAGVTIIQQPFDGPFGRTCVFADPDGYRLTANENPWDRFPLGGRKER